MIAFLFYIFGIALLDSFNPSAIALVIIILLTGGNSVLKSLLYILGIFITYFIIGFGAITLYTLSGINWKLDFSLASNFVVNPPIWGLYLQLVVGSLLIITPWFLKKKKNKAKQEQTKVASNTSLVSIFLLGVTVTFVEFSTAFPYIGAISSLIASRNNYIINVLILLIYNFIFVLPPLIIVLIYWYKKANFIVTISKLKILFEKYSTTIIKYGIIVIGVLLCLDSLLKFV